MLYAISGFAGSGKDTIADYLIKEYQFTKVSFAASVKDAVSVIFSWDRELLEGSTLESRAWREEIDDWWATRLNIPSLTPRFVMQNFGTDIMRKHFHDDIWIASVQRKIQGLNGRIVITDARFPNELKTVKQENGTLIRVKRGSDPDWVESAIQYNLHPNTSTKPKKLDNIHPSEYSWLGTNFDYVLENNSTIVSLYEKIDKIVRKTI